MSLWWLPVIFSAGFGVGIWWCRRKSEECRRCEEHFHGIIRDKDSQIHGLKSTRGALAKEVQNLVWSNNGYNAR